MSMIETVSSVALFIEMQLLCFGGKQYFTEQA